MKISRLRADLARVGWSATSWEKRRRTSRRRRAEVRLRMIFILTILNGPSLDPSSASKRRGGTPLYSKKHRYVQTVDLVAEKMTRRLTTFGRVTASNQWARDQFLEASMEARWCTACGQQFTPRPQAQSQTYCAQASCLLG